MKYILISLSVTSLLALSLSACTGGGNGIRNSAPDRTVSQPRRGSY